jgi:hypothetical protein
MASVAVHPLITRTTAPKAASRRLTKGIVLVGNNAMAFIEFTVAGEHQGGSTEPTPPSAVTTTTHPGAPDRVSTTSTLTPTTTAAP